MHIYIQIIIKYQNENILLLLLLNTHIKIYENYCYISTRGERKCFPLNLKEF